MKPVSRDLIVQQTKSLLERAPTEILDKISSSRRDIRTKAIQALIAPLDETKKQDFLVYQALALQMSLDGDSQAALSYIETLGMLGHKIDINIVEQVYEIALKEIDSGVQQGKKDFVEFTNRKLELMFLMFEKNSYYLEHPRYSILSGKEWERRGNKNKAIALYNKAIEDGEEDGFFLASHHYRTLGQFSEAENILRAGWALFQERKYLDELVRLLVEDAQYDRAKEVYQQMLVPFSQEIPEEHLSVPESFCLYSGRIETDEDLRIFDLEMAKYTKEGGLYPSPSLHKLALSAEAYIASRLDNIQNIMIQLMRSTPVGSEELAEFHSLIGTRLWYTQVHLLALRNPKYLADYLTEIDSMMYGQSDEGKELIRNHLENDPSGALKLLAEGIVNSLGEDPVELQDPDNLYDAVNEHVAIVSKTFLHGEFYEVHKDVIVPILRKGNQHTENHQEDIEDDFQSVVTTLKYEADYFESLSPQLREKYYDFLREIDTEYGRFMRRELQTHARENYGQSLGEYPASVVFLPQLALLYIVEKIISDTLPVASLEEYAQTLGFFELDGHHALILAEFWMDVDVVETLEFLGSYESLLTTIDGIHLVLDGLKRLPPSDAKVILKKFHELCRIHFHARGWYDHINKVFEEKNLSGGTPQEQEKMLLSEGTASFLKNNGEKSLGDFQRAAEMGSREGMLHLGEIYEATGFFDEALEIYQKVYVNDSNLGHLSRIIGLCIQAGFFEKAQAYITLGLSEGHDLSAHIFSLLLWQGKLKQAFQHAIWIIGEGRDLLDLPEGTLFHLYQHLAMVFESHYTDIKQEYTLKILASYLLTKLLSDAKPEILLEDYVVHWQCIQDMVNELTDLGDITQILEDTLGSVERPEIVEDQGEKGVLILHSYALYLHQELQRRFHEAQENKDMEQTMKHFHILNFFISSVVHLLSKFPNTQVHQNIWKKALNFLIPKDMIVTGKDAPEAYIQH